MLWLQTVSGQLKSLARDEMGFCGMKLWAMYLEQKAARCDHKRLGYVFSKNSLILFDAVFKRI